MNDNRDCKHGHLARSCDLCDLERREVVATRLLARWYDWARAHGHLDRADGIARDTFEMLHGKPVPTEHQRITAQRHALETAQRGMMSIDDVRREMGLPGALDAEGCTGCQYRAPGYGICKRCVDYDKWEAKKP